jgi:hypothetical protein
MNIFVAFYFKNKLQILIRFLPVEVILEIFGNIGGKRRGSREEWVTFRVDLLVTIVSSLIWLCRPVVALFVLFFLSHFSPHFCFDFVY